MPQVIPFVVGLAGTAAWGSTIGGVIAVAASLAVGSYTQRKAEKKARDEYNAGQVDRMANVVTTVAQRELVLGRVRKGGSIAFRGATGQYSASFFLHLNLAAHEIDAVEEVWFNDQKVTINSSTFAVETAPYSRRRNVSAKMAIPTGSTSVILPADPVAGSVTVVSAAIGADLPAVFITASVSGRTVTIPVAPTSVESVVVQYQYVETTTMAWVRWDLGAPGSISDWGASAAFPGMWTSAHRGEGVAKLFVRFEYDDSAFPNGLPNVTVVMRGAKLYDPRTGLTAWSQNPALMARHVYQHQHFGKATVSAAEDVRFSAAANICDQSQSYTVGASTFSTNRYRAGLVVPFGTPAASVLDDLTQAMAGMWAFASGELFLRAGAYSAPVATFGDADVAVIRRSGDSEEEDRISIGVHRERAQKFNVVNARIWDSGQSYKQVGLTPLKGTALITRDGEELAQEVQMPAVPYSYQALHIAGVMMRDARDPLTIEVPLKMNAYAVELFDTVSFSFSRYGWDSVPKTFIVMGRMWDREKGVIRLTCKETAAAIFTADSAFDPQGYADNTALPDPWTIEPPGTLTITSGTSELLVGADGTIITRARVAWPEIEDQRITLEGKVEVQWADASLGVWRSITVDGSVSSAYINGLADGMAIIVRARTRTSLASSDWGGQQSHTVEGKSVPPNPPTGVSITQELVFFRRPADADLAGVRIRSIPGFVASPVFSRGTDVIEGIVLTSPARIERRLYGVQTIMVVSEDTSGNQSEPVFASLDFGQPDVDSAIWTRAFADESFPGTYTTCSLSGGAVVADVDPTANLYALGNLYGEPDVFATLYQAMVWEYAFAVAPYAGTLALTSSFAGNSPTVEYRVSGDTITDVYASSDVYASGDLYGAAGEWTQWPGALQVQRATPMEFRVSIGASAERGSINTFTLMLIMEEKAQTFTNITVDSAGTRLTPSSGTPPRNWVGDLRAVYGWPAVDGSGAIAGRVLDFSSTLGPLIQFVNTAGDPVTAIGTVKVEGYSDD